MYQFPVWFLSTAFEGSHLYLFLWHGKVVAGTLHSFEARIWYVVVMCSWSISLKPSIYEGGMLQFWELFSKVCAEAISFSSSHGFLVESDSNVV